jgi:predicted acetyltransferase
MLRFVLPCKAYEQKALEFIQEFHDHGSPINGTGGLDNALKHGSYNYWLDKVRRDLDLANIPPDRVPAYTYFYVREADDKIVGMINIRLTLSDFLRREGGHIGYCIRPTERRQGYATAMLGEALKFCRTIGMRDFILSCGSDNPASAGVIRKNGGVLDAEFYSETFHEIIQRYRIT